VISSNPVVGPKSHPIAYQRCQSALQFLQQFSEEIRKQSPRFRFNGLDHFCLIFTPAMGDKEDPATGSAAGPLAAYLQAGDVVRGTKEIVVEQGDEVGRPGRIHVRLQEGEVLVGGRSFVVAEGKILAA
jgi:PhzF family phenazine biosynthesis protein